MYPFSDGVYECDGKHCQYWRGATLETLNSYKTSVAGSYFQSLQALVPFLLVMHVVSNNVPYGKTVFSLGSLALVVADYMSLWWEGWKLAKEKYKAQDELYPVPIRSEGPSPLFVLLVKDAIGPHYEIYSLLNEGRSDQAYGKDEYLQLAKILSRLELSMHLKVWDEAMDETFGSYQPTERYLEISLLNARHQYVHVQKFTASPYFQWLDPYLPLPDDDISGGQFQSAIEPLWIEHITHWLEANDTAVTNSSLTLAEELSGPKFQEDLEEDGLGDTRQVEEDGAGCQTLSLGNHVLIFDSYLLQDFHLSAETPCLKVMNVNSTDVALSVQSSAYNQFETRRAFLKDKTIKKVTASAISFSISAGLYYYFRPTYQPAQAELPPAPIAGHQAVAPLYTAPVLPAPPAGTGTLVTLPSTPPVTFGPISPAALASLHPSDVKPMQLFKSGGSKSPQWLDGPFEGEPLDSSKKSVVVEKSRTVSPSKTASPKGTKGKGGLHERRVSVSTNTVKVPTATIKPTSTPVVRPVAKATGSYQFRQLLLKDRPKRNSLPQSLVRKDFPVFAHDETRIYPGQSVALKDVFEGNLATAAGPEPAFGSAARARFDYERLQFVLEKEHSYIQQLFPIWDNKSTPNPKAPLLTPQMIVNIQSDSVLLKKVVANIDMMMDFWGLRRDGDAFEVVPELGSRHKKWTQSDHNLRRVTRVITFLASVGFKAAARNLEKTMNGYRVHTNTFWSGALWGSMHNTDLELFLGDYDDGAR
ncbi:opioid growth factor receptor-related protein [Endozoicomonas arenosclerae]|uniref:opioid growth factor receptor-related protein n=1 Tax=Endozoicomonas arenosclerae TaxID=1633495 RepID=UPI000780AB0D|nr:opioid growth factor receptor-related protein [Endozoicomonas arenosclerae]